MKGSDAETDNSSVDNDENITPHPHDVLCGRGGQSNNHPGNEWFRRLVRSNRSLYRTCPKHTKLLVAKAIVQAVQQQEPPGRFIKLKETDAGSSPTEWISITYAQAVNKTSQALREKDPAGKKSKKAQQSQKTTPPQTESNPDAKRVQFEASKNGGDMDASNGSAGKPQKGKRKNSSTDDDDDDSVEKQAGKKRKVAETFVKPSWWGFKPVINRVIATGDTDPNGSISTRVVGTYVTPGANRTANFQMGRSKVSPVKSEMDTPIPLTTPLQSRQSSMFRFLSNTGLFGRRESAVMAEMVTDPAYYGDFDSLQQPEQMGKASVQHLRARQLQNQQNQKTGDMHEMSTSGLLDDSDVAPPPKALKSQMSDWLGSFLPTPSSRASFKQAPTSQANGEAAMPPPPGGGANMGRSASSAFFGLVESPSLLLTSLKSGVTSMFGESVYEGENETMPAPSRRFSSLMQQHQPVLGVKTKGSRRDSLLDDVEETDDIRNLRNIKPAEVASQAPRFY